MNSQTDHSRCVATVTCQSLGVKNYMYYLSFAIHCPTCKVKKVFARVLNLSGSLWIKIRDVTSCLFLSSFHTITTAPCYSAYHVLSDPQAVHSFITHPERKGKSHLWTSGTYPSFSPPHILPKPFALVVICLPRMQPNSALACLITQVPVPELWKNTGRPPCACPAPCSTTDCFTRLSVEQHELTLMVSLFHHLPSPELPFSNWVCKRLSSL